MHRSAPVPRAPRAGRPLLALALALLPTSCGGDDEDTAAVSSSAPPAASAAPAPAAPDDEADFAVPAPGEPLRDMALVEDLSEEVANRFFGFSHELRRRDFDAAADWLTEGFRGRSFACAGGSPEALHLGAVRVTCDPAAAPLVDRAGFLAALAGRIGPWSRVDDALWKVKGAEFETGADRWGRIRFRVSMQGVVDEGRVELVAWADARVVRDRGSWRLDRLELTSLEETSLARPIFTEVSAAAGVAHQGLRFGQPGNDSFAWNGAAAGDVDGDGLWDLYVPSRPRSFLYVRQPDGTFADEAAERGVDGTAEGPGGGTGAVFLDFDADGDSDLAVADTGWRERDGTVVGNRLRLYVNDGEGRFVERGEELGFDALCNGFTLSVLDFDLDGWPDVFVCAYGRPRHDPNDSWVDARNGGANLLLRNLAGKGFEDVAARAGLASTRWSYASAAADFDRDGDQDLYVANDYGPNALYRNEGDGTFTDVAGALGVTDPGQGMGACWGDLDGDGRLDLYSVNMSSTAGNRILQRLQRDEGVATLLKFAAGNTVFLARPGAADGGAPLGFEALPPAAGGVGGSWAWGTALADLDLDGRLDVLCVNGFITGDLPDDT